MNTMQLKYLKLDKHLINLGKPKRTFNVEGSIDEFDAVHASIVTIDKLQNPMNPA